MIADTLHGGKFGHNARVAIRTASQQPSLDHAARRPPPAAAVKLALALFLVIALAGCGGGGSRQSYVADATEICSEMTERIKQLGVPESYNDTQLYARQAKDAVSDGIRDLRDLDPPPELEEGLTRYVETLEQRRRQLDLLAAAADENSMTAIQQAGSELSVLDAKAKQDTRRAGIGGCEDG